MDICGLLVESQVYGNRADPAVVGLLSQAWNSLALRDPQWNPRGYCWPSPTHMRSSRARFQPTFLSMWEWTSEAEVTAADVREQCLCKQLEIRSSDSSPGRRRWAGVRQLIERCPTSISSSAYLSVASPVCNLSTGEVETAGFEVQGCPWAQKKTKMGQM